jgi:diadenosine tetraphosphatase ApaH/serine/threonine PP2A family protein phosphatase
VRLLLLSDIHSNLEALEACLDAAPEYDRVANLGDVVGYGACPNQVSDLVRALAAIDVRGNHDRVCCGLDTAETFNPIAAEAALWTAGQLSERNLEWLRALPHGPVVHPDWAGVQFAHGAPVDEDFYINSDLGARLILERVEQPVTFFGHTHIQGGWRRRGELVEPVLPEPVSSGAVRHYQLKLEPGVKYILNPGSVGQPRDRDRRAAFAVYDSEAAEVNFYRTPYDIDSAQDRIFDAGLPRMLALRLSEGR